MLHSVQAFKRLSLKVYSVPSKTEESPCRKPVKRVQRGTLGIASEAQEHPRIL